MNISELCIRRPVFASVLSLVILLVGLICYQRLSVREYPDIDEPAVSVTTTYPGASAQIMESQVTKILEDSISGIEGVKQITSSSQEGSSNISIEFVNGRDPDDAAAEVRDRVSRVRGVMPDEIDEPIIRKVEADASPIMWLPMTSDKHTPLQLSDYADRYVVDRLQTISGVAQVLLFGEQRYAMRIWLDPNRMNAEQVTAADIEDALRSQNIDLPSGRIEGRGREFTVFTESDLNTPEQFASIIIANRDGRLLRLRDVGRVTIGVVDDRQSFRVDKKQAVALGVVKQSTANPLDISHDIQAMLPAIRASLPDGMQINMAYDSSLFISKSIENVYKTLAEAVALVVLVIFLFLRSARATLVPLVTIPVSLIGAFAIAFALGFSVNTLTLLALVLAIGLVVDDAIVMLENIYRHIEEGMEPFQAAITGAKEITFAVIAMTLTLATVYMPMLFQEGRTGKLFIEFSLMLAGAVLISGFVALTLSPMMSSLMLRAPDHDKPENPIMARLGDALTWLDNRYHSALDFVLGRRWIALIMLAAIGVGTAFVFTKVPGELAPTEDRGVVFLAIIGPEGATVDYMKAYVQQLEEIVGNISEKKTAGIVMGIGGDRLPRASSGLGFIRTVDWEERTRNTQAIAGSLMPQLMGVPGVLAFPIVPASLGGSAFTKPVEFVIKASGSYEDLARYADAMLAKLAGNAKIQGAESDLKLNTPQLLVQLNRPLMADLGVSVLDVGRSLETLLAGRQVTRYKKEGEQYDVIMQTQEDLRTTAALLNTITVRSNNGALIPLSSFVTITETVAPQSLNRFDRMRSVKITANLAPGVSLGEALDIMDATAKEVLPQTALTALGGQSREFRESSGEIYFAFGLALILIFLVLAAQFESWLDPLVILFSVPLSMFGAVLALYFTGNTMNIYSQIGLITLVGLITKHGILIVDFANANIQKGMEKFDAVLEAAALRLRPILMTTAAMVLGAVPLAMAHGAGAESRAVIGWVIVGGMSIGTFFTLFIVPVMYTFFHRTRPHNP